jgi:UDP-2-acetamido-2,6-beta-L-arabino-hexul-4-ose reductase
LILGSDGFIGKNLKFFFKERSVDYEEFSKKKNTKLSEKINKCDFIIHLADKIKSKKKKDFDISRQFTSNIVSNITKLKKKRYIIYASSTNLNTKKNLHYSLKKDSEKLLKSSKYLRSFIIRLPNIFGKWCKPNYNSFFTTACYNIAKGRKIVIKSKKKIPLIHVSDLSEYFLNIINHKFFKQKIIYLKPADIVKVLLNFKYNKNLDLEKTYNLSKDQINKLYSTYLFYNKNNNLINNFTRIRDVRGDFAELIKEKNFGQISLLTVNPKQERGNHFHDHKVERFIVISGYGELVHQNVLNNKIKSFRISDKKNRIYSTIPGWSHKIKNLGKKKLIILVWANEVYDKVSPDTIKWEIK